MTDLRCNVQSPIGVAVSLAVAVSLGLSSCGSAATTAGSQASSKLSCDSDLAELVDLLRSGLPTYDYEPVENIAALVQQSDVVVSGTIDSVVRVAGPDGSGPDGAEDYSWTTISSSDSEILAAAEGISAESISLFSADSKWVMLGEQDPLSASVSVEGVQFIAFLRKTPAAPGGFVVDVQGLAVACLGSTRKPESIIESLPNDALSLAIDEIADAISASG